MDTCAKPGMGGVGVRARVTPEHLDELWDLDRWLEQPDLAYPAQEPLGAGGDQRDRQTRRNDPADGFVHHPIAACRASAGGGSGAGRAPMDAADWPSRHPLRR